MFKVLNLILVCSSITIKNLLDLIFLKINKTCVMVRWMMMECIAEYKDEKRMADD